MYYSILKKAFLFIFILGINLQLKSQDRYVVFLKDKANSPFTISNPSAYLSARAVQRRTKMNISIDSLDLPIPPTYLNAIKNAGAIILNKSKWLNTVTVQADTAQIINIGALSYVDRYQKVFGSNLHKSGLTHSKFDAENIQNTNVSNFDTSKYGGASNQTKMLNAQYFHEQNLLGKSMVIAIIDAGFRATDTHHAFDSLRNSGRILGTWDFATNNSFVYDFSNHGTSVLSCIAANVPDSMIGMAPAASFYLLRSEEEATEYLVEEYNWAAAAEFADSVGADIINSSLGYTEFDAVSQNHTYNDMNGNTAPCTIAADIAFDKGVFVVNSAGNSGSSAWFFIGAPADGKNVFSIGSVDPQKNISGFSSNGPTSDTRIKPDVVAQGGPAWIAKANNGSYGFGSGTSFSGPIMAGFVACATEYYHSIFPNATAFEIKDWIKSNSDRAFFPDNQYGYGLPNALELLKTTGINFSNKNQIQVYPNPAKYQFSFYLPESNQLKLSIYSTTGVLMSAEKLTSSNNQFNFSIENLMEGLYVIKIETENKVYSTQLIKSNSEY